MRAYGCIWVHMGALGCRGMGKQANKASRGHLGSCGPGFGSYGRGNFPGHDVLCHLPQMVKNECRWVTMDADGWDRVWHHGRENKQGKKSPKLSSGACFGMHGQRQEMHHVGNQMIVACRESTKAKKGEQGLAFACLICLGNETARKQTARQNKAPKQARTNMSTQGHKLQKKNGVTKVAKNRQKTSNKHKRKTGHASKNTKSRRNIKTECTAAKKPRKEMKWHRQKPAK